MANIGEYKNDKDLFLDLGLYQGLDVDCNSFTRTEDNQCDDEGEFGYTEYKVKYSEQFSRIIDFMKSTNNVYMFCPLCNKEMSFKLLPVTLSNELLDPVVESYTDFETDNEEFSADENGKMAQRVERILSENRYFDKVIVCTHNQSHIFKFFFRFENTGTYQNPSLVLKKIGQYPSAADFLKPEISKYKSVLGEQYREFSKAIGLFADGIGIGSFVYLRRIIENLVFDKYKQFSDDLGVTEAEFKHLKFDGRISILKGHLPTVLVTNKNVYGIVSKGIHELSEDECKNMFPSIKIGIELILDDLLAEKERAKKVKSFETFVAQKTGELRQK